MLQPKSGPLSWLKSGLLWRTFFLLALVITISQVIWVASFSVIERAPRANQVAAKVVSILTITRAALTHSAPELRRELLFDLASNEGVRIYPLEPTDKIDPLPDNELMPEITAKVRSLLGAETRFAGEVNDVPGFWVSFRIDGDDDYWLVIDRDRIENNAGMQVLGWAGVTLFVSLLGSVFISRLINQPIARLAAAARAIGSGTWPAPLPEKGPREIRQANRSFNTMMTDLSRIESDRALILAGISHDLRTPITRMLLEVEMAALSDEARAGMLSDLAQMDAIIGQFLDYARPSDESNMDVLDLHALLNEFAQDVARYPDVHIHTALDAQLRIRGHRTEFKRVLANLVENARRYGKTPGQDVVELDLQCHAQADKIILTFADCGTGVPEADMQRLLHPFARLESARSQADGAGLGLAIVERIIVRHGGQVSLGQRNGGGLTISIVLPRTPA